MYVLRLLVLTLLTVPAVAQPSERLFKHAAWISPGYKEDSVLRPCPMFKKEVTIDGDVRTAHVLITAHGLYEAA